MTSLGWICLGVSGCWLAYILWDEYLRPARGDGKGGFWDFVKNPRAMAKRGWMAPPGKAFPLPDGDAPEAWDASIRTAIEQHWDTFEYVRMVDRSPHVPRTAVRLMRDTAFAGQAWPNPENSLPHWNLSALEILLGKTAPIEVLPHVVPFLEHDNQWCRQSAAEILGKIDDVGAAEVIRRCLATDDHHLRDGLFQGITASAYERVGNRDLTLALWVDLSQALAAERVHYSSIFTVIRRMVEADRERARFDLHAEAILRWDHRNLADILHGLSAAKIPPARNRILDLIRQWRCEVAPTWSSAYHRGKVLGACLMLLLPSNVEEHDAETVALVMALLEDPSPETRSSVCPALLRLHGITEPPASLCHTIIYEQKGMLSPPQRVYWEVHLLLAEVQNGGWHQYFVNSSGDGWKYCLAGVEEMKLGQVAEDMRRAISLFGTLGPDTDRDRRWEQLSQFTKHQDKVLEQLRIDSDTVEVALARYAVRHREDFLPA